MTSEAVCSKCSGTGFIITEHANLSGASPCDCRAQGRAARLEDRSQIPTLYRKASFDNFVVPGNENPTARRELTTVLLNVRQFVRDFPNEKRPGLLLIGETGCGKTHLSVAALRGIIAKGFEGLFVNYQTLLNNIRAGYDAVSNSANREAYQTALDAEVLLLDDLGAHRTTDWVEDTINSIVTYRCDHRKPLIATTNMPDPDAGSVTIQRSGLEKPEYRRTLAEQIGARARSRLFEMCTVIRMPLIEDYRVRKGKQF
jgi:DNA replication protein DnaC